MMPTKKTRSICKTISLQTFTVSLIQDHSHCSILFQLGIYQLLMRPRASWRCHGTPLLLGIFLDSVQSVVSSALQAPHDHSFSCSLSKLMPSLHSGKSMTDSLASTSATPPTVPSLHKITFFTLAIELDQFELVLLVVGESPKLFRS